MYLNCKNQIRPAPIIQDFSFDEKVDITADILISKVSLAKMFDSLLDIKVWLVHTL